jgi:hypothetical protein
MHIYNQGVQFVETLAPESTWQKTNLDTRLLLQIGFFFKGQRTEKESSVLS